MHREGPLGRSSACAPGQFRPHHRALLPLARLPHPCAHGLAKAQSWRVLPWPLPLVRVTLPTEQGPDTRESLRPAPSSPSPCPGPLRPPPAPRCACHSRSPCSSPRQPWALPHVSFSVRSPFSAPLSSHPAASSGNARASLCTGPGEGFVPAPTGFARGLPEAQLPAAASPSPGRLQLPGGWGYLVPVLIPKTSRAPDT